MPALAFMFERARFPPEVYMQLAVGTSLAVIVPTSVSSVYSHYRRGAVLWSIFRRLTPGVALGAMLGPQIAAALPGEVLNRVFGGFVILVALQILTDRQGAQSRRPLPDRTGMTMAGAAIGTLSAVLGIGGGSLMVPFFTYCSVAIRNAVATSSACGFVLAVIGAVGFLQTGWGDPRLPQQSIGFVYLPAFYGLVVAGIALAPVGAWLAHTLPTLLLKRLFALLLGFSGLRMLLG